MNSLKDVYEDVLLNFLLAVKNSNWVKTKSNIKSMICFILNILN